MAKLKKLFNADYLQETATQKRAVNEKNRTYIDRFVSENYKRLVTRFAPIGGNINSSCFGSMDKLNETLFSLYTDPDLRFGSWEEASVYLKNKFTEKEIRIPLKKPTKGREDNNEENINE